MFQTSEDYLFTSIEQTEAVFFPKQFITTDFIAEYPDLVLNLLQSLSIKTRILYSQISCGFAFDSFGMVCRALYSMHLYNREGGRVVPHLTQQDLGVLLGLHRSSLHKALARLKDEGIIGSYSKKALHIHDIGRLLTYARKQRVMPTVHRTGGATLFLLGKN
ncbi:MAG: helix-turn-helix domain-containing protein [Desulfovibrio sp.]|nr:helix-turn-helix domain-containing protein [Desulfovibrio sp.]